MKTYHLLIRNLDDMPLTHSGSHCVELSYRFKAAGQSQVRDDVNKMWQRLHSEDRDIHCWLSHIGNELWHDHQFDIFFSRRFCGIEISCKELS